MGQCKGKIKATGERCRTYALKGESFCLFHSRSKRAEDLRNEGRKTPKAYMSREKLLRILTQELEAAKTIKNDETRIKIRSSLAEKIILLQDKLQKISDLEKLIREHG